MLRINSRLFISWVLKNIFSIKRFQNQTLSFILFMSEKNRKTHFKTWVGNFYKKWSISINKETDFCFCGSRSHCTWWRKACPFETGRAVSFYLWCVKRFSIQLFIKTENLEAHILKAVDTIPVFEEGNKHPK